MGVIVKKIMALAIFIGIFTAPAQAAPNISCKTITAKAHAPAKISEPKAIAKKLDSTFTISTNCGEIIFKSVGSKAPRTITNMSALANGKYFDNSICHRLTTQGLYVLQCGDPTASGSGGPGFQFKNENLPNTGAANYPKGTVAMANSGPNTNGSQFFLVYADTQLGPDYTIWGKITKGMEILEYVASKGAAKQQSDGKFYYGPDGIPVQPVQIYKIRAK